MKLSTLTLSLSVLASQTAFAVSVRTAEIFNKGNRELAPPPRSLKANSEDARLRMRTGSERLARKIARSDSEEGSASASLVPVEDPDDSVESGSASASSPSAYRPARTRSMAKAERRSRGYNGDRFFGLGFVGAGAYGVFGAEADFGIGDNWTAGFGLGTGMAYSTWAVHGRYYFQQARWSPLVEVGYAQWDLSKIPRDGAGSIMPHHLAQRFFGVNGDQVEGPSTAHIIYPGLGVMYQNRTGLAALFEIQYFVNASDFSGALMGTMGVFFYF